MIVDVCQRWARRCARFVPPNTRFDRRRYEVAPIADDRSVKAFVETHHYSGTVPPMRWRFGLYERTELVGCAVFSVPAQDAVLSPFDPAAATDLGRFVLLDRVPFDAETWFLARCTERLPRDLDGFVMFSDPHPRTDAQGEVVFRGHYGRIYQGFNATFLGRSHADTELQTLQSAASHVCRQLGIRGENRAEVLQDIVLVFLEQRPDLRHGTLFSWAWAVVRNRAKKAFVRRMHGRRAAADLGSVCVLAPQPFERPDDALERRELVARLHTALERQKPATRALLHARYFDELDTEAFVQFYAETGASAPRRRRRSSTRTARQSYYVAMGALRQARLKLGQTLARSV